MVQRTEKKQTGIKGGRRKCRKTGELKRCGQKDTKHGESIGNRKRYAQTMKREGKVRETDGSLTTE